MLSKKEEILKLRAAEQVLQDVIDNLNEELDAVESALRERRAIPESETDVDAETRAKEAKT